MRSRQLKLKAELRRVVAGGERVPAQGGAGMTKSWMMVTLGDGRGDAWGRDLSYCSSAPEWVVGVPNIAHKRKVDALAQIGLGERRWNRVCRKGGTCQSSSRGMWREGLDPIAPTRCAHAHERAVNRHEAHRRVGGRRSGAKRDAYAGGPNSVQMNSASEPA